MHIFLAKPAFAGATKQRRDYSCATPATTVNPFEFRPGGRKQILIKQLPWGVLKGARVIFFKNEKIPGAKSSWGGIVFFSHLNTQESVNWPHRCLRSFFPQALSLGLCEHFTPRSKKKERLGTLVSCQAGGRHPLRRQTTSMRMSAPWGAYEAPTKTVQKLTCLSYPRITQFYIYERYLRLT